MSITPVDKVKIMKYLRENPIGEIYYLDLCDALGKRGKIKDIEFLEFFVEAVIKEFKKNEKISIKQVSKLVVTVKSFLEWVHEAGSEVDEVILDKIRSFEEYYDEYLNRTNNDIDLEFTPLIDRHDKADVLIIAQDAHQVFGLFNGKFKTDDGEIIIKDALGFAEKVKNRW